METPAFSVVVAVRDGAGTLPLLLDALAAQRDAPAFETIVADDGSRDATAAIAATHPVGARVVSVDRPGPGAGGPGAARD
ncbi:MAG: glycosyltransferase, partial [Solirubrobacteraceae bacterium]